MMKTITTTSSHNNSSNSSRQTTSTSIMSTTPAFASSSTMSMQPLTLRSAFRHDLRSRRREALAAVTDAERNGAPTAATPLASSRPHAQSLFAILQDSSSFPSSLDAFLDLPSSPTRQDSETAPSKLFSSSSSSSNHNHHRQAHVPPHKFLQDILEEALHINSDFELDEQNDEEQEDGAYTL